MIFRHLQGPLRKEAGEPDGGGEGDKKPLFTEEQLAAIAAAIKPVVSAAVNDGINGYDKRLQKDLEKLKPSAKDDDHKENKDGENKDENKDKPKDKPDDNPQLAQLTRRFEALQTKFDQESEARKKAEEKAEQTEKASKLRDALAHVKFVNKKAADAVFTEFYPKMERDEDGSLFIGETPLEQYVAAILDSEEYSPFILAERQGGAGASGGKQARKSAGVQLEDIKRGAPKEVLEAAARDIVKALNGQ